jgi:acetoin utilization deacetylase AcuC-like enzyme
MPTIIIQHDDCLRHDPGPRHPESAERIKSVLAGLNGLKGLEYLPAPRATADQASRVHPEVFQQWLTEMEPEEGRVPLNELDTLMNKGSMDANLRGSGGVCFAIEQVHAGNAANAFCAIRPPGHHSGVDFAMGFCLFNHVAVGARHAQTLDGIDKVAIIDFDVHHGNGTQQIFEDDPTVMFVSSHEMPLYPGSGYMDETGCGNVLNLPLAPGVGGTEFRRTWSTLGLPAVHSFQPDLILVSAGFDAHRRDPLGHLELEDSDYEWLTREILDLARDSAGSRVVSTLEGGYDLEALSTAPRAHVEALLSQT